MQLDLAITVLTHLTWKVELVLFQQTDVNNIQLFCVILCKKPVELLYRPIDGPHSGFTADKKLREATHHMCTFHCNQNVSTY
jgi:hypothetical protein